MASGSNFFPYRRFLDLEQLTNNFFDEEVVQVLSLQPTSEEGTYTVTAERGASIVFQTFNNSDTLVAEQNVDGLPTETPYENLDSTLVLSDITVSDAGGGLDSIVFTQTPAPNNGIPSIIFKLRGTREQIVNWVLSADANGIGVYDILPIDSDSQQAVLEIQGGTNIAIDDTDPLRPIVNGTFGFPSLYNEPALDEFLPAYQNSSDNFVNSLMRSTSTTMSIVRSLNLPSIVDVFRIDHRTGRWQLFGNGSAAGLFQVNPLSNGFIELTFAKVLDILPPSTIDADSAFLIKEQSGLENAFGYFHQDDKIEINSAIRRNVINRVVYSTNTTLPDTTYFAEVDTDLVTIQLPNAPKDGQELIIYNSSIGIITIDGGGSNTIDGSLTLDIESGNSVYLLYDETGTNYIVVSSANSNSIESVQAGNDIIVDITDPNNPIVSLDGNLSDYATTAQLSTTNNNVNTNTTNISNNALAISGKADQSDLNTLEGRVTTNESDILDRQLLSEKNQVNGYAGLDASTEIVLSQLGKVVNPVSDNHIPVKNNTTGTFEDSLIEDDGVNVTIKAISDDNVTLNVNNENGITQLKYNGVRVNTNITLPNDTFYAIITQPNGSITIPNTVRDKQILIISDINTTGSTLLFGSGRTINNRLSLPLDAGNTITLYYDAADNNYIIIGATTGGINSIVAGDGINIDLTDPNNPVISTDNSNIVTIAEGLDLIAQDQAKAAVGNAGTTTTFVAAPVLTLADAATIVSLENNNNIFLNDSFIGSFDRGEIYEYQAVQGDKITSSKGHTGAYVIDGGADRPVELASAAYAGRQFFWFAFRGVPQRHIVQTLSLSSRVRVYGPNPNVNPDGTSPDTPIQDVTISPFNFFDFQTNAVGEYYILASQPVTLTTTNLNLEQDQRTVAPLTDTVITHVRGFAGGDVRISALFANTEVSVFTSSGLTGTGIASPGSPLSLHGNDGSPINLPTIDHYRTEGWIIVRSKGLIAGFSGADAAGTNATTAVPITNTAQVFGLPFATERFNQVAEGIGICSPYEGNATLYNPSGGVIATRQITRKGTLNTGAATTITDQLHPADCQFQKNDGDISTTVIPRGSYIITDVPAVVVHNSGDARTDRDETNVYGITPENIKAEIREDSTGLLRRRTIGGGLGIETWVRA